MTEWADPTPATFFLLAPFIIAMWALTVGLVPIQSTPLMGIWITMIAVPLLIIAVISLARKDVMGGTLGIVFGGLLGLGGGMSAWMSSGMNVPPTISGYVFIVAAIVLLAYLPAMRTMPGKSMFWMQLLLGIAVIQLGAGMAGLVPPVFSTIGGWLLLVFGAYCLYAGTAIITNMAHKKPIMPL